MTDTTQLVEISADAAPSAGARIARSGGQLGAGSILLQLVIAFGWWGANTWSPEQTTAATSAVAFALTVAHNAFNWFRSERVRMPQAVTVEAVGGHTSSGKPAAEMKPPTRKKT